MPDSGRQQIENEPRTDRGQRHYAESGEDSRDRRTAVSRTRPDLAVLRKWRAIALRRARAGDWLGAVTWQRALVLYRERIEDTATEPPVPPVPPEPPVSPVPTASPVPPVPPVPSAASATTPSVLDTRRDHLRLVQWEMERGGWREAIEHIDRIAPQWVSGNPVNEEAGWLVLARAVAHFQLGAGRRFRRSLATVLRATRRSFHRSREGSDGLSVSTAATQTTRQLRITALELAWIYASARGLTQRSRRLARQLAALDAPPPSGSQPMDGAGLLETESRLLRSMEAAVSPRTTGQPAWHRLPELLGGPRELWPFVAALSSTSIASMMEHSSVRGGEASPSRPGKRLLVVWQRRSEEDPQRACPAWLAPAIAGVVEQELPRLQPEERVCYEQLLTDLSVRTPEAFSRACVLRALAECALWHAEDDQRRHARAISPSLRTGGDPAQRLRRARTDLGLSAGLFRRLGMLERAEECEERWSHLMHVRPSVAIGPSSTANGNEGSANGLEPVHRFPTGGTSPTSHEVTSQDNGSRDNASASGFSSSATRAVSFSSANRRPLRLADVKRRCAEAGFHTRDGALLRDLAPLLLIASKPLPILVTGESGTGKEVIARAIHRWSGLRGDFIAIHCGAIPRDLLESELFGHVRGSFTGASADKVGLVEAADQGTLFLDEIGEMSAEAQMKMLRVLETGEVRRVGDLRSRKVRVRLVAATHRDLDQQVTQGTFRLDLLHRIRGLTAQLSPLRERPGDVPVLAERFLSGALESALVPPTLSDHALAALLRYDWPGNVRELRAALLRAVYLATGLGAPQIEPAFFGLPAAKGAGAGADAILQLLEERKPAEGGAGGSGTHPPASPEEVARLGLDQILAGIERGLITEALDACEGNRTRAAKRLGNISRTTLLSKMKRLGIA